MFSLDRSTENQTHNLGKKAVFSCLITGTKLIYSQLIPLKRLQMAASGLASYSVTDRKSIRRFI